MKRLTKDMIADFTWDFGMMFYVETPVGNYEWQDPGYGGDNTLRKVNVSLKEWLKDVPFGRDKGTHVISDYCGEDVIIIEEE